MIHQEYASCEWGVILFVAGIVIVVDLLLLGLLVIIYKYKNKIHKVLLGVLIVLWAIIVIVFNIAGVLAAFILQGLCH